MSDWTIYARDATLARKGQVDDFQSFTAQLNFNDVSTWLLDMPIIAKGADILQQDGAGIVLTLGGVVKLSGPVTRRERVWSDTRDRLRISGYDDTLWLKRRLVHPQPTTSAPPYNAQAYDTRTGQCSAILRQYVDFNAGPSALTVRQVSGLTLAADPALGTTMTGQGRWQNLLTMLQELALAGGGLGFRVQQSGTGIQFSVYGPANRSATVIFSRDLGNLAAFNWSEDQPAGNYVFVAGGGEGTARTIYEAQDTASVARWGRVEVFRDRRDTTDTTQLAQSASDELQTDAGPMGLSMTPIDLPQMMYGSHYELGDKVTVVKDGAAIQDLIRQVNVRLTPEDQGLVVPTVGTPGRPALLTLFDVLRDVQSRLVNLERR